MLQSPKSKNQVDILIDGHSPFPHKLTITNLNLINMVVNLLTLL